MIIDVSEPILIIYLISLGGAFISLTLTIKKNPPESYKTILPYYLALPLIPIIALSSYPLTIHLSLRDTWNRKIREDALRVRRRR